MKQENTYVEKRGHLRTKKRLLFRLSTEGSVVVAESINVSCNGAYCQVQKHIPLMTCLKVDFALSYGDQKDNVEHVECSGVVVRVEEVLSEHDLSNVYNMAIFFNEIEDSQKKKLANFINGHRR